MAYLTQTEVKSQYPALAASIDAGKIDTSRVDVWIANTDSLIDEKVGQRYSLPFSTVPPLIKTIAYELFNYFWQKDVNTPPSTGDEVSWLYPRYDRIIKLLDEIRDGKTSLIDSSGNTIEPSTESLKTMQSNHLDVDQIFTMGDGWNQSIDDNYDKEPSY